MKPIDEEILSRQLHEVTAVENVIDGSHLQPPAAVDFEELLSQCMPELADPPVDSFVSVPILPQVGSL